MRSLEGDHQCHDFAGAQTARAAPMSARGRQQAPMPSGGKRSVKVIEIAKQSYNVHRRAPGKDWFGLYRVDPLARSCPEPCLDRTRVGVEFFGESPWSKARRM